MSTDFTKIQLTSSASSLKILKEGAGTFVIPNLPGAGDTFGVATIAHGYTSDNLLTQASVYSNSSGAVINPVVLPWSSNDGRVILYTRHDSTNLYIYGIHSDSGGSGFPSAVVSYSYRILIP